MTISSQTRKAGPFVGNDSTTAFPFAFKVFSAADMYVVKTDTDLEVETVLVLNTDYTVSLNVDQNANPGGTITLPSALATGFTLTVTSNISPLQQTDLTNQGGFYPSVITNALDKLTILIQQALDSIGRSLKLPVSTPSGVSTTLPLPSSNKLIGWNTAGDGLQNVDPTTLATIVAFGTANADVFDGDGVTTQFNLSANPAALNNLDVSIGGVTQTPGADYTWTSGTVITFTSAPPVGTDNVLVRYMQALPQGNTTADLVQYTPAGAGAVATNVERKLRESVSAKDFGAVGDGVADDSAAIAAMGIELAASGVKSADLAGLHYRTTTGVDFSNFNHVEFVGGGTITDGTDLYNFPSDDHQRVIGQEYLAAFHKRAVDGNNYRIKVWGDSRPQGNSQTGNFIWHNALKQAARQRGYLRGVFENNSIGGSTVQDWTNTHVDTYLTGTNDPHLVVFCAGINDLYIPFGPATPEQVVSRLDAFLTKVRVTKGYALDELSIVVVVPVSAYNPSQGRDPRFIEPLRTGFKRMARKHQVCVVDGYGVAADGRNQRGLGYAADISAPEVIHQNNVGMVPILSQLIDAVLPNITPMLGGGLYMESGGGVAFTASQPPADYPVGVSLFRATPGGGGSNWPADGFVKTINFVDDIQVQYNFAIGSSSNNLWFRKGRSNAWGSWVALAFDTGRTVTPAAGFVQPGSEILRTTQHGSLVTSDGYLSQSTPAAIAAGATIGTIEAGNRPARTLWGVTLSAFDGGAWQHVRGRVNPDGTIVTMDAISINASRVYMNGAAWSIA